MLTYKYGVHVNPYVAASLLTQFTTGYTYSDTAAPVAVSDFFDPAYLKQSAGVGWKISKELSTRLGAALREILTNHYNQYAAQPLENEFKKSRIEGGLELVTELELPIEDNVLLRAKADLFSPIKHMDRIVFHGETSLIAKVSKVFSAELNALFIDDPASHPTRRSSRGFRSGISYSIL